jgi:hypothetical protein
MILPKSCDSASNLKAGSCERSAFPLAVFGFSITSDVTLFLSHEEMEIITIPAHKIIRTAKKVFINGAEELGCKSKKKSHRKKMGSSPL